MMRVAIVGAGGVGGYFGGRLAVSGQEVTFIARGAHAEAIRRNGLQVTSINGDFVVTPASVTDQADTVGPVDLIIVAVKAWQVPDVADTIITPLVGPSTLVIPLENGIEAPRQLAEVLGRQHVGGGLCKIISEVTAPGCIRHSGAEPYIGIGELDGSRSVRMVNACALFREAGVRAEIPGSIQRAMWEKFLLIAPWSGIAAVARVPIGLLRQVQETRTLLEQGMKEIQALAAAEGVDVPADAVAETLSFIDALPPGGMTSMQRDLAAGRPSELEAINGAVVRLGQIRSVDTPVHRFVYSCLRPLEMIARDGT